MQTSAQNPDQPDKGQQSGEKPHRIVYFMPGEVVVLAEHAPGMPPKTIIQLASAEIQRFAQTANDSVSATVSKLVIALSRLAQTIGDDSRQAAVLTFKRALEGSRPSFSLIFVKQIGVGVESEPLIEMFDHLNRGIIADRALDRDLTLSVIAPNWLLSSAQTVTKGGPGGRPVPVKDTDQPNAIWKFWLPPKLQLPLEQARQQIEEHTLAPTDVDVAILDTAPSPDMFANAKKFLLDHEHPLLKQMLGPDGALRSVIYAADLGVDIRAEDLPIDKHEYNMPDHGLFAASIVNAIAPEAQLYLIQVLNDKGVGTLQALARGLQFLQSRGAGRPLVVNCSLTMNMPLPGHSKESIEFWQAITTDCELIKRMGWLIQWIHEVLSAELGPNNLRVVAAAGNDAENHNRPQARYPAALDRVIGVAAINSTKSPASYSNLSDTPLRMGIATYGGDVVGGSGNDRNDSKDGVLGAYIRGLGIDRQNPEHNQKFGNGWARWSGTSFAAPQIAGTLAALVGLQVPVSLNNFTAVVVGDLAAAEQVLRTVDPVLSTQVGEDIFPVSQGAVPIP